MSQCLSKIYRYSRAFSHECARKYTIARNLTDRGRQAIKVLILVEEEIVHTRSTEHLAHDNISVYLVKIVCFLSAKILTRSR